MRLEIPHDLPREREIASQEQSPREKVLSQFKESHPILHRLKALTERASQHKLNHQPPKRTQAVPRHPSRDALVHDHGIQDAREIADPRRSQRNHLPPQTIGLQLRPEEQRAMLELGRFRVIRTADLAEAVYGAKLRRLQEDLNYLRSKGLVETRHINLRRDGKRRSIERIEVATLTKDGRAWLRSSGEIPPGQTVYAGFVKPREIEHDSLIYRAFRKAEERLTGDGSTNLHVRLDFEIKSQVQKAIHAVRKATPERNLNEIKRGVAERFDLPFVDGKIQIPDARIEFDHKVEEGLERDQGSRTGHEDIEVLTAAYHSGHLRSKAQAGFRNYAASADRSTLTSRIEDDHELMQDILDL
jgi:hypothetical protein